LIGDGRDLCISRLTGAEVPGRAEWLTKLTALELYYLRISIGNSGPPITLRLPALQSLKLTSVCSSVKWVLYMLRHSKQLSCLSMVDVVLDEGPAHSRATENPLHLMAQSEFLPRQLAELQLVDVRPSSSITSLRESDPKIQLGAFSAFDQLTEMTVEITSLTSLVEAPLHLRVLHAVFRLDAWVLQRAGLLKRELTRLLLSAPGLVKVEVWGEVRPITWREWQMCAFLLHEYVTREGLVLEVNLA
jgi:hypothetical protein